MGQKTNAVGFRLQVTKDWPSRWFSDPRTYADQALKDIRIRRFLDQELRGSGLVRIDIERTGNDLNINLHVTRPGLVIGRAGERITRIKEGLKKFLENENLNLNVFQVKKSQLSARLLAEEIAQQLERRLPYKRVISRIMKRVQESGHVEGMLVAVSGRLNGVRIARTEKRHFGSIPLQTIDAVIDYAQTAARTKYGLVGVKVWLHKKKEDQYA